MQTLIDEEYSQIRKLLAPGLRRRPEARARIRVLLAMEAHLVEGVVVSKRDVDRIERAIKKGGARQRVFPRLSELGAEVAGDGPMVTVRFSKTEGMPVRLVRGDEEVEAAAFREVDLQRKFHWGSTDLAKKLGLTAPKAGALRRELGIDEDVICRHDFVFGKSVHRQYSDNACVKMKRALDDGIDMNAVWREHRPRRRGAA